MDAKDSYDRAFDLHKAGDFSGAEAGYRAILAREPRHVAAICGLAEVVYRLGRNAEALEKVTGAAAAFPTEPSILLIRGIILVHEGRFEEAITNFRVVLELDPNSAEACSRLATALLTIGRANDAIDACRRSLALRPGHLPTIMTLCSALSGVGDLDEVIDLCRSSLARHPEYRSLYVNLGWRFENRGCWMTPSTAIARHWLPDRISKSTATYFLHSIFTRIMGARLLEEHLKWAEIYVSRLEPAKCIHPVDPAPGRRVRIGYVAHDLGNNPLGRFLAPLLANRDRNGFEVICYCDRRRSDAVGDRLLADVDLWRSTGALSDAQLADQIRSDRIDILVDLTMHSNGSRLLAFARKPAPVQVSYLAYCSTTGLKAIDYRLTDRYLDPPAEQASGEDVDVFYSEKSVRLPDCYWCYPPPAEAPSVGALPALIDGRITFGCLNEYSKVTNRVWSAWCEILNTVNDSRLILHAKPGSQRNRAIEFLERHGIDQSRVEFVGRLPLTNYFAQYNRIDIALDPFPYSGGTTTFDSLWMGVPVITLAGKTAVGRGGVSILSNLGLSELIGDSTEAYVRLATMLAPDLPRIQLLRNTLRPMLANSPLTDGSRFARNIEAAYRQMWRAFCERE